MKDLAREILHRGLTMGESELSQDLPLQTIYKN